jgi:hypothetical protein
MKIKEIWKKVLKFVKNLTLFALMYWSISYNLGFPSSQDKNFEKWGIPLIVVYILAKDLLENEF